MCYVSSAKLFFSLFLEISQQKQDRNWIIIIITGLVIVKEHEIHIEPKSYKLELLGELGF